MGGASARVLGGFGMERSEHLLSKNNVLSLSPKVSINTTLDCFFENESLEGSE